MAALAEALVVSVEIDAALLRPPSDTVSRAELAQALSLLLFDDLLRRVPAGALALRPVPGSFFEFITRQPHADGWLDLGFDTSNAQAIFKMTEPVLVELSSTLDPSRLALDDLLESALGEQLEAADGGEMTDVFPGKPSELWAIRHGVSESLRQEGEVLAFDISVPRSSRPVTGRIPGGRRRPGA